MCPVASRCAEGTNEPQCRALSASNPGILGHLSLAMSSLAITGQGNMTWTYHLHHQNQGPVEEPHGWLGPSYQELCRARNPAATRLRVASLESAGAVQ